MFYNYTFQYTFIHNQFTKIIRNLKQISKTLNYNYVNIETLQEKVGQNIQIIPIEGDIIAEIKQARIGIELWRYILYITIILLIIEMIISNVKRQK